MFTDLDLLEIGDTFSLSILDRVLTYEVDNISVVEPENLEPLKIVDGEDLVTLYTCTPYGINTHRLLVRGHRVEIETNDIETVSLGDSGNSVFKIVIFIAVICLILILFFTVFIILHQKAKKYRRKKYSGKRYKKG